MYPHYCAVHGPVPVPAPMGYFPMVAYSPQHKGGYGYASSPQQQQQYPYQQNSNNNNNNTNRSSQSPSSKGRNHNNNMNNNSNNHQYDKNDDVFGNNLGCPSAVKTSRYNKLQQQPAAPASPSLTAATTQQTPYHQVTATPNASARRTVPHNATSTQAQEPHTPAPANSTIKGMNTMNTTNNNAYSIHNNNMGTSPAAASPQTTTGATVSKALPPNSGISTSVRVKPITGRQLERDLSLATKEELLQMLVELSTLHPAAQSFITCRAALLVLQGKEGVGSNANTTTSTTSGMDTAATPLAAHKATPSAATTGLRGTTAARATATNTSVSSTPVAASAVVTASSPVMGMSRSPATNARINAENRPFTAAAEGAAEGSTDHLHPCLRTYGRCRHPASCPFRSLPRNVCLAWLRKECSSGLDCPHVHRLPGDDPALDVVALPRRAEEQEQPRAVVPSAGAQVRLLYRLYQDEGSRRDPHVVREMCLLSMEQLAQRYSKGELEQECHEDEEGQYACEEEAQPQQQTEDEQQPQQDQQEGSHSHSASHNSNSSASRREGEGTGTAVGSPVEGGAADTANNTITTVSFPPPTEHTPVARALDLNA